MGECPASAAWMLELVELVESEEISGAVGRDLLGHVFENRDETRTPRELAKQTGRLQTSSQGVGMRGHGRGCGRTDCVWLTFFPAGRGECRSSRPGATRCWQRIQRRRHSTRLGRRG